VIDGRSERGGHPVVRQPLRQWQLRITAYADRLAADLEPLDWPETRQKQRDWIGRSEGAEVDFPIAGRSDALRVYTTRPDTLFGATYMVIAPDHPLTLEITASERRGEVERYVAQAARKSDMERTALNKEKTGVFTGAHAINPLNDEQIPIFTADYVLGAYGTGAIMAVPAHDERDFEFAQKFDLPIVEVVSPDGSLHDKLDEAFSGDGIAVRSGQFDGQRTAEMKASIIRYLEERGIGRGQVNYRIRDWVFSRQRYWGEPIPIYFPVRTDGDPRKGAAHEIDYSKPIAVDEAELPLLLPDLDDYHPGDPAGPLVRALDWRFFQKDGRWYARETNTMPQWAGSCWYFLRFLDPQNDSRLFSEKAYDDWMPIDLYVGGSEHTVLHLLYARFWHKALFDIGIVKHPEPFLKLVHQGMILGYSYRYFEDPASGRYLDGDDPSVIIDPENDKAKLADGTPLETRWAPPDDVENRDGEHRHKRHGVRLVTFTEKMSKARGNVINPDDVVREFGADSLRIYEMFMGPLEAVKPWQTAGIQGVRRFLDRVHAIANRSLGAAPPDEATERLVHKTVKKVTDDIEALRFNTAVSAMMILTNHLNGLDPAPRSAVEKLVLLLSPFAPHLAEEIWAGPLSHPPPIADAVWPDYDERLTVDEQVEIAVQVNGKVRGRIPVQRDASEAAVVEAALADANVERFLGGKAVRKVVYVPGRILTLIVS
jgi:leucyl-tRNA synthetase